MSAPEFEIRLTEKAQSDFIDILSFTLQSWGQKQFIDYKNLIESSLNTMAGNPQMGYRKHGFMVYPAGKHRIFYRIEKSTIHVLRILHNRMDAVRHLPE